MGSCSSTDRSEEGDDEVRVALHKNSMHNDDNSDNDDGGDGAELLDAAREGFRPDELLTILEKNPALIRVADPVGDTVLHMAARGGDTETVCKLIAFMEERQDLQLNEGMMDRNTDGDTALHEALKNGYREVAHKLVNADKWTLLILNNDNITPYKLAKEAGYDEMSVLIRFEATPCSGVADIEIEVVKKGLLGMSKRVAEVWIKLFKAIQDNQEDDLVEGLMNHGKQLLRHQYHIGKTLLHVAVEAPTVGPLEKLTEFMVRNGLTDVICLGDINGDTAVHLAVKKWKFEKALCLIKAAPKVVYQVNHWGVSPLYLAVKRGCEDLVKHMVSQQGCLADCATEILQHQKHISLAHLAIRARSSGILQTLMEHLPELIKVTDEKGWRPLSYAANKGYLDEVTYLLTNFPKSATKYDKDGSLPIHKAVGGGDTNIVKAFLEYCPQSLHHVDRKGRSVLHIAVRYARADILSYITKNFKMEGSFLYLRDNEGQTFMDYTKELKH